MNRRLKSDRSFLTEMMEIPSELTKLTTPSAGGTEIGGMETSLTKWERSAGST